MKIITIPVIFLISFSMFAMDENMESRLRNLVEKLKDPESAESILLEAKVDDDLQMVLLNDAKEIETWSQQFDINQFLNLDNLELLCTKK